MEHASGFVRLEMSALGWVCTESRVVGGHSCKLTHRTCAERLLCAVSVGDAPGNEYRQEKGPGNEFLEQK